MRKALLASVFLCVLCSSAFAQNWATVTANNITDLNQRKLASGQLCFLGTDQNDTPINFMVGGGGMVLKRQFCSAVSGGAVTAFTVPNPALTAPTGVYYRVTVIDSATGQEALRYTGVTFSGATFNFDTYTPNAPGFTPAPLSGTSVTGNLGVTGNITASGTIAGSNIPATIPGVGSCTNQFVTALNTAAGPACSNTLPAYLASTHVDRAAVIQDPDFEGSSTIPPPGWATQGSATLSYEIASPAPGKSQSIKLTTSTQFSSIISLVHFSALAGDIYTVSCNDKSDGVGNATCQVDCHGPSGLTGQFFGNSNTTTSWKAGFLTFTVPANSQWCVLSGENASATQPSTVWFDQFQVQKANFPDVVNTGAGYRIAGAAASGNFLRGNGTSFVSSALQTSDLTAALTAPPAIGGTTPGTVNSSGGALNGTIGATTPNTGTFTTLTSTGGALNGTIGATTPNSGNFTTLTATGLVKLGRVQASGSAPTCSVTGAGTGAACNMLTTASDSVGSMFIVAGSGSGSTGSVTVTFSSSLGTNGAFCLFQLGNGSGAWNPRASIQPTSGLSSSVSANWDNNGASLVNTSSYTISFLCFGR